MKYKIWIDEAGRGPWLGPVVASAFAVINEKDFPNNLREVINDSKKLTEKKRDEIYHRLIEESSKESPTVAFWVWVVDNFVIDEINIKQANKLAMTRALEELLRKIDKEDVKTVLVDGNDKYKFDILDKQPLYVVWWDGKIFEIWAASIIAKVFRDRLMTVYSELYPTMNLENHKWYWTKKHKEYLTDKSKVTNIHRKSYKPVKEVLEKKEKLLIHVCCGPDVTIPIIDLKDKYDIVCFWYDPNIQPKQEYQKRLEAFQKVCEIENIPYIEWEYDVPNFFRVIKWLEQTPEKWEKCTKCYDMRLKRSAEEAQKLWIKYYTSSLNISPHKDLDKMFKLGDKQWKEYWIEFLKIPFRKNKGFERSVEYTKKHDIYRQDYCWCYYSDTFPERYKVAKNIINKD